MRMSPVGKLVFESIDGGVVKMDTSSFSVTQVKNIGEEYYEVVAVVTEPPHIEVKENVMASSVKEMKDPYGPYGKNFGKDVEKPKGLRNEFLWMFENSDLSFEQRFELMKQIDNILVRWDLDD